MRILPYFIVFLLFISCNENQKINRDFTDQIIDVTIKNSSNETVEFPDLYTKLANSIPDYNNEKLILVEKLKAKGFKVTNSGRGNYPPLGPRIVCVTLQKTDCECEINKIYYSTISDTLYQMAESIKCIKIK
ncbi:MAG: hypothetical protein V4548_09090 [Bacteroidota bacterium]